MRKVVVCIDRLDNCEYSSYTTLSGLSSKYICIPSSLILDKDLDSKRISVYSYLNIKKGLDNNIEFSIPSMIKWSGNKPDTHSGGMNSKFVDIIKGFIDRGYLTFCSDEEMSKSCETSKSYEVSKSSYMEFNVDTNLIYEKCHDFGFAVLYVDEIEKILKYKKNNDDKFFNNSILLLVFAFLRSVIYRRPNRLRPEERNIDGTNNLKYDIDFRRNMYPEAYTGLYSNMSKEIGVSSRVFSKAVHILKDIGLIDFREAYRIRNENGEYKTQNIIFSNTYKREGIMLLDSSSDYSENEIMRKEKLMKKYNNKFIIDKRKSEGG